MGDGFNAFLIIILFIILYNSCYFIRKLIDIQDNWNLYKCNPLIMPFANFFNVDSKKNFDTCVGTFQDKQMPSKLVNVKNALKATSDTNKKTVATQKSLGESISSLASNITSEFNNQTAFLSVFTIEIQKLIITIQDIINKIVSVSKTGVYFTESGMYTGESIYNAYIVPISLGSLKKTK